MKFEGVKSAFSYSCVANKIIDPSTINPASGCHSCIYISNSGYCVCDTREVLRGTKYLDFGVTVLTPEIYPSLVAVSCSTLLTLSSPEPVKFTDGISVCGIRFIAAVTLASDGHMSRVSVLLLRTSPKPCPWSPTYTLRGVCTLLVDLDIPRVAKLLAVQRWQAHFYHSSELQRLSCWSVCGQTLNGSSMIYLFTAFGCPSSGIGR
jgi:hypothetical protein